MVWGFTQITQETFGTLGSQVTGLLAVITNDRMSSVRVMASLMTMAARARLSFVSEMNQNFSKAHVVGNGAFDADPVMTNTILNVFPSRFTKISTART